MEGPSYFTILIPEHVHIRIHSGGPRGGLWNMAWQQFKDANPSAPAEAIYRHAGELMFRFELTGPVVPYARGGR
ncbi:TIGR02269 family lipoprotein [Archangium violaceum]|uniref:SitA6 family polymorphic toxin lipoprotein n=1 Tax=Archangium violaceum TaxID=83451 RepID=UPI00094986BA|nr:TIGR02269 family lipoprotein [Archangium violaceum]